MALAPRPTYPPLPATEDPRRQSSGSAPVRPNEEPYVGRVVLGRYLVEAPLETGWARATYSGVDVVRDCSVLVQRAFGPTPEPNAGAAALRGLGVAPLLGFANAVGGLVSVFESRGRQSLARRAAGGGVPLETCLSVAVDVASGLAAAHAQGLAHGGLRAEDIWLHAGRHRIGAEVLGFGMQPAPDQEWETNSGVFTRREGLGGPAGEGDMAQFGRLLLWLMQRSITTTRAEATGRSESWWGWEALCGIADRCVSPAAPNARTVRRALRWIETRHHALRGEGTGQGSEASQPVVRGATPPPRRQRQEPKPRAKVIVET